MCNPSRLRTIMYEFDFIADAHTDHGNPVFLDKFLKSREELLADYSKENLLKFIKNDEEIYASFQKLSQQDKDTHIEKLHTKIADEIEFSEYIDLPDVTKIFFTFIYAKNTEAIYVNGLYADNFSSGGRRDFPYLMGALPRRQWEEISDNEIIESYLQEKSTFPKWLKDIPNIETVIDMTKFTTKKMKKSTM